MTDPIVFRSATADPADTFRATIAAWERQRDAAIAYVREQHPEGEPRGNMSSVDGFTTPNNATPITDGWRFRFKDELWVPNLRRRTGKDRADELNALGSADADPARVMGSMYRLPSMVLIGNQWLTPGMFIAGDRLVVTYAKMTADDQARVVRDGTWESLPLAAYYTILAAREAAKATA